MTAATGAGDCAARRSREPRPSRGPGVNSTGSPGRPARPLRYDRGMFKRQRTGSVVCPSCGNLVGVNDERCYTCGRWNPGMWGFAPLLRRLGNDFGFTTIVIGASATLYAAHAARLRRPNIGMNGVLVPRPGTRACSCSSGRAAPFPVFGYGRWWTILSAGWLHGSALHILFNMMWVRRPRARPPAKLYGPSRLVIIYTVAGARRASRAARSPACCCRASRSSAVPATPSARPRRSSVCSARWSATAIGRAAAWFAARRGRGRSRCSCSACSCRGVDNWAHAGGFAGGYLAAIWLDPLKRERTDHVVVALRASGSRSRPSSPRSSAASGLLLWRRIAHLRLRLVVSRADSTGFPAPSPGSCRRESECYKI